MTWKKILPVAFGVLTIALVGALLWKALSAGPTEESQDFPDGTHWLCKDCGKKFTPKNQKPVPESDS